MITLISGVPGAGKTCYALSWMQREFKDRPVYYFDVAECTVPGWTQLDQDDLQSWFDLPTGSVVLIDEAYKVFPMRVKDKVPDFVQKLAEHRHLGIDFVLIAQAPQLLDVFVRRLIGQHFHVERPYGMSRVRILHWQKCVTEVDNYHERQLAATKNWQHDKKVFSQYKSAELHTHKAKIPLKLVLTLVGALGMVTASYAFYERWSTRPDSEPEYVESFTGGPDYINPLYEPLEGQSEPEPDYLEARIPRVADVPSSAPVYDELTKPKSYPKLYCVINETKGLCQCYTQQVTRVSTSQEFCIDVAHLGFFDPGVPDLDSREKRSSQPRGSEDVAHSRAASVEYAQAPSRLLLRDTNTYDW
jgi:zona occludens toxin